MPVKNTIYTYDSLEISAMANLGVRGDKDLVCLAVGVMGVPQVCARRRLLLKQNRNAELTSTVPGINNESKD